MKIRLVVSCARYNVPDVDDVVELPDGLNDDEIENSVAEDLQQMAAEYVDCWWERLEEGDD